jgi:oxalate decarboxylase/phosphoglucose isomerase-like protein (cupin superfamily)
MDMETRAIEDARGLLLFPLEHPRLIRALKAGNPRLLHIATLKPGAVRGNHRHPSHEEYILIVGAGGRLVTRQGGKIRSRKTGNAVVKIPRNVPHAVVNRGKRDIFAVCFYGGPARRDIGRVREELA